MPIRIELIDGDYCPIIYCDHCRMPIDTNGNVLFPKGGGEPFFVHKECNHAWSSENGGRQEWAWQSTLDFVLFMGMNMGYTITTLKERLKARKETGI